MILYIITFIIGILCTLYMYNDNESIYKSPIANIPWELIILLLAFPNTPFYKPINTKYQSLLFLITLVMTIAFTMHLIRDYHRYQEIYNFTINNKIKTAITILLLVFNIFLYYMKIEIPLLFLINGIIQYYIFKEVKLVYDITLPMIIILTIGLVLNSYGIINMNYFHKIFIESDLIFHMVKLL